MTLIYECLGINLFKGEIPLSRVIFINDNFFFGFSYSQNQFYLKL